MRWLLVIVRRFRQPSSWAGIAAAAAVFLPQLAPELVIQIGVGIASLLAIVLDDGNGSS